MPDFAPARNNERKMPPGQHKERKRPMNFHDCKLSLRLQEKVDAHILFRHLCGAIPIGLFLWMLLDFHYNFSVYVLTDTFVLATRLIASRKYHPSLDLFLPFISWIISTMIVLLVHPL